MSFSQDVKEELMNQINSARHCQIAELAAIFMFHGRIMIEDGKVQGALFRTENAAVARKYFTLLRKTFNINTEIIHVENVYTICLTRREEYEMLLMALKYITKEEELADDLITVNPLVVKSLCCKRAFLRGAFLSIGSMSDPEKGYHLEFVCTREEQGNQICQILLQFEIEAKMVIRKKYFIVYIKEGASIVDLLNIMEAHISLMNLENLRIVKEMRNSINRRVNCEAANITKTVNAATKQIDDILKVKQQVGFDNLPKPLQEVAIIRLQYPEATLKELGELLEPPVGKSGVNHRLRKLCELVELIT